MEHSYLIDIWAPVRSSLLEMIAVFLFLSVIAVWSVVVRCIAQYDIYRSCDSGNAALYLVLSIVFPITEPIFILLCHKKDGGMPQKQASPMPGEPSEIRAEF